MKAKHRQKRPESYRVRSYRERAEVCGLVSSHVKIKETDLHIQADRDVGRRVEEIVLQCRMQLEDYIIRYPVFYSSLVPLPKDFTAPPLVQNM